MQLHNIKSTVKNKSKKRVGRGGARGTYSGRGIKGQKAHSSGRIRPPMRDTIKKIHKKRGYRFSSIQKKPVVLNLSDLDKFESGSTVSPQALLKRKIIQQKKGALPEVKILGTGNLKNKLNFSHCIFSKTAKQKIEKIGGTITHGNVSQ